MMDAILYWNNIALEAVAIDHTNTPAKGEQKAIPAKGEQGGPTRTARALAIVHLAMYDAFNSIAGGSTPYLPNLPVAPPGASPEAAINEAAAITLIALYSSQRDRIWQASQKFLSDLPGTTSNIEAGIDQGRLVAAAILENRSQDGSGKEQDLPYVPSQEPGKHRPDPQNPNQGFLTPNWGKVATFAIDIDNYLASPPPPSNSPKYTEDFQDVKQKGVISGGTRTSEETAIGLYWAYDGAQKLGTPPRLYNQVVRQIALKKGNNLGQNARLFALINMAMGDAGIQCWLSKYYYNVWRPVVGIREASPTLGPTGKGDNNPNTKADPFWLPLGAPRTNQVGEKNFTPGFPAYPSGHATFGAACFDMVSLFYGTDDLPFDFVSEELNGESLDVNGSVRTKHKRHFNKLSDAIIENARSRVYLGVHWQFDADSGVESGKQIAGDIFNNFLTPC
ncbi:vanadium-dependent haloperoxidase [Merismopedia glauca]|uniref:Chloroperoxidase n=1 Tax=Merismopedia glauca CCAP 1448/3 TaxID=1296344 RepID=A0A2T1C2W3_9CYAN|nr:vanadium-dependent haloperoxidase [Merismopedia glauca]PSB02615.1 chloroperoxidase [Merismopedia glauca CCAP 1448/3]